MMRDDAADITIILDRTGSMEPIRDDTIGGFNRFLEDQRRLPGACALTLVQFDSQNPFDVLYQGVPVAEARPLSRDTYVPRASTPLLDAMGRGINATGARLAAMPEADRPGKVVFVVITDGLENASKEFKKATVKEMVDLQRETYKWEFVFLGANMDAIAEGGALGVVVVSSLTTAPTPEGVSASYSSLSRAAASYRSGAATGMAFLQEDRDRQAESGAPRQ